MSKVQKKGAELMVAVGLIAYGVWAYYGLTIVLCFVAAAIMAALAIYNATSGGSVFDRSTPEGLRRERRMLLIGLALALVAIFILGTGRQTLGQIGAQLLVIVFMLTILGGMIGFGGGKKKD